MVVLVVFKDLSIKSHKGTYKVSFCNNLSNVIKKIDFSNSHIIIDKKVLEIYADLFNSVKNKKNFLIIKASEKNKSLEKIPQYINWLVKNKIKRSHKLIAIGGGIIQDITCFISATLLRGVDWYFIPTTLLSQADSCIGSKSSINSNNVKNILGTFTPPNEIFICTKFLLSLKNIDIKSGIGEMLKVHAIAGPKTFISIKKNYNDLFINKVTLIKIIYKSLQIKKKFIEIDEFDKGPRNIFNYGHSFGHAIERATSFKIPHGIAVTIGCDLANFTSMKLGLLQKDIYLSMQEILQKNYFEFKDVIIPRDLFFDALEKDKKNIDNKSFSLVLPNKDGRIFIDHYKNNKKLHNIINDFLDNLNFKK